MGKRNRGRQVPAKPPEAPELPPRLAIKVWVDSYPGDDVHGPWTEWGIKMPDGNVIGGGEACSLEEAFTAILNDITPALDDDGHDF